MKEKDSMLVIDIGNSNVVLGFWEKGAWKHVWRLLTLSDNEAVQFYSIGIQDLLLEAKIDKSTITGVAISSVVPALNEKIQFVVEQLLGKKPFFLGADKYHQLNLGIERPHEIGTDLVANALAACVLFKRDMIVVDFGTALTFTSVTANGTIKGVSIAPGLKTALQVLFNHTAQLPEAPLEFPTSAVGRDTIHAIQSGVLIGYVGLVRHIIQQIREELGSHFGTVATGGLSALLTPLHNDFDTIEPNLTLEGLRLSFVMAS